MSDQQNQSQPTSSATSVQQVKSAIVTKFQSNKALVLKLHSILSWEQDIYPIVVTSVVSIAFLIIHLMNSSILTTLSYLGIACALLDLGLPMLSGPAQDKKLTDKDNQRFDKICLDLAKLYALFKGVYDTCCSLKSTKPKVYYPSLLTSLLVLAVIGNKFNNLFLTYIATLLIVLYPGLDKRGIPQKAIEFVYVKLGRRPPAFAVSSTSGSGDRRGSGKKN